MSSIGISIGSGKASCSAKKTRIVAACCVVSTLVVVIFVLIATVGGVVHLKDTEQLVLTDFTTRTVKNGPGSFYFNAFTTGSEVRDAVLLSDLQYVQVTNELTGEERAVAGPQLFFRGAYDQVGEVMTKTVLRHDQFAKVLNSKTGELQLVRGPTALVLEPTQQLVGSAVQDAFKLLQYQYVKLVDDATGAMRVEVGENLIFPTATENLLKDSAGSSVGVTDAVNIDHENAALVLSKETGQQRLVTTPGRFFPAALEEIIEVRNLIRVEPHEVAIVQDNRGGFTFHMGDSAHAAAAADADGANASGGANSSAPKATSATRGTGQGTAFFLPPHSHLVSMQWSTADGAAKEAVTKIDLRAQYAFFEYTVRTSDNVELLLEGTIFWQVFDVPTMVERTADPRGDVWYHARSSLIQAVSGVTLEEFMSGFNALVSRAANDDREFYEQRGVQLLSLEVTSFACKDATTAAVLQEIIQETTNRINRLQQQRSENEVEQEKLAAELTLEQQRQSLVTAKADNDRILALAVQRSENEVLTEKLSAEITRETSRKQLVTAKATNDRLAAEAAGQAQGLRFAMGVEGFATALANETVVGPDARLELYRHFHDQEVQSAQIESTTKNLGGGSARLFLTPSDLNLKLYQGTGTDSVLSLD